MNIQSAFVKYKIYDFFELFVGAISLLASLLSIWVFWRGEADSPYFIFVLAVFISFGIMVFIKLMKMRKVANRRLKIFSETFHKFAHLVRDELYGLRRRCKAQNGLDGEQLLTAVTQTAQRCVDWIAYAMSESTGEEVSVCIKYFPEGQSRNISKSGVEELRVKTLVRSYNSSQDREPGTIEQVGNSTPLLFLMEGRGKDFRAEDVRTINRHLNSIGLDNYRDGEPNWEDHYRSVIVVPIRIEARLQYVNAAVSGFDILGFLWADSKSASAFPGDHISAYSNFLKSFADVLYQYFDQLDYCLDKEIYNRGGENDLESVRGIQLFR